MAGNKTLPTRASVAGFLGRHAVGQQLADCRELVNLFREISGSPARMWGPSIVGFGRYHYVYESGREGDAPLLGFSPRKPQTVIYLSCGDDPHLVAKLGKYRSGVGCLYIKSLDDIDRTVLRKLAIACVKKLRVRHGGEARPAVDGFMQGLAAPARRALEGAGLTTPARLAKKSESEVRDLHGMGPGAIARLRVTLRKRGLRFKMA